MIKADWDAGKGIADRQGLRDVVDAARETDNAELGAKAEALARAQDLVDQNKQQPLDQQAATETEIRRQLELGTKEFAGADMVLKQLQAKTEAIQKGLEKDPIATAVGNFPEKWKTPDPLNVGDQRQFAIGLAQRAQIAQGAAQNWRVPPLSVLDEQDVQTVKAALANPDLAAKASIWSVLATIPEVNRGPTFEKIAKGDPNALAEAGAGSMMATQPEMAKSIMAGLQIMARNDHGILKQFEPKSSGSEGYDVDFFKALPPTVYGSETRLDPTGNYAKVDQMVKARYAYLAANDPRGAEYSTARLNQAVADVTGGTVTMNGAKTVAPVPGMPQATFDGIMAGISDRDLAGATNLNGQPLTANLLRQMGHLEAIGPGRYLVNLGGSGEKPIYAYSGWGDSPEAPLQRFVLDLTGRQPAPPLMTQPFYTPFLRQGLKEIQRSDQPQMPSYGGIRG